MMGTLTASQIDDLLREQKVGRIGCCDKGKPYVVPVIFARSGHYIYCQSREGRKIRTLRANPEICFQVDVIQDLANWRSVTVFGRYEEMKTPKQQEEVHLIMHERFAPIRTGEQISHRPKDSRPPEVVEKQPKAVYFRFRILEQSGRFEKN
ncbi:MAG TPA: pyridoxamine 5'-phosphate oxidase family protein [Cyclobacteriaceae bacterium]|nr:pyridoxamine 5'-phosphate oxidase family protein [Cyclobacteriaceae bacterium]